MKLLLFEDDGIEFMYPAAVGRAGFTLSCAGYNLIQLLSQTDFQLYAQARDYVQATTLLDVCPYLSKPVSFDFPALPDPNELVLLVNALCVPAISSIQTLKKLGQSNRPAIIYNSTVSEKTVNAPLYDNSESAAICPPRIAAAVVTALQAQALLQNGRMAIQKSIQNLNLPDFGFPLPVFCRPHDLVAYHLAYFEENQNYRLTSGLYKEIKDGLFAADGVSLGEYMVVNAKNGPIVVDSGASIGPYCYLCGPVYIGPHARIIEHAAIKDKVATGRITKIGGEVEGSTIEPYTNKQHHGFLGHSYVGSWVNLGAGTCNSDLKNTYGTVVMEYPDGRFQTNMQFLGCIMGDFAKSAINTSIFTGKLVGACSMLYGYVTRNVPSFVNYARAFGQITEVSLDVLISTQARMFARRNIQQNEAHIQLLKSMYEVTKHERLMANEPIQL